VHADVVTASHAHGPWINATALFTAPLVRRTIAGIGCWGPSTKVATTWLEHEYGKEWRTPLRNNYFVKTSYPPPSPSRDWDYDDDGARLRSRSDDDDHGFALDD
jgi:hypothetical protein